jgi:hypothetical protein
MCAQCLDAVTLGGVVAGGEEVQAVFAGEMDGLLRGFAGEKSVYTFLERAVSIEDCAAPVHQASRRIGASLPEYAAVSAGAGFQSGRRSRRR